ncbi:hypothetical protein JXR93_05945 [bacterium]|nr:hypothetical protein [bacterium]
MKNFVPKKIYIEPDGDKGDYAEAILAKFPDVERVYVTDYRKESIDDFKSIDDSISIGKEILLMRKFKGAFLKKCPGSKGLLCCNYYVINAHTNCPFDCTYCSLQNYLNTQAMVIFSNIDDMLSEISDELKKYPNRIFRIGTGELADSLAIDSITNLSSILIDFFSKVDNAVLELKTKSDSIDLLEGLNHNGKTVISFSVNPQKFIDAEERGVATLEERLAAAKKVESWGYRLAFHFDPVVMFDGFENEYKNVIKLIYSYVKPDSIDWISVGGFRYSKEIKDAIKERFPKSTILSGEFWMSDDQKMRYLYKERSEMYKMIRDEIRKYHPKAPLYMCMESSQMWREVFGYLPYIEENAHQLFDFR